MRGSGGGTRSAQTAISISSCAHAAANTDRCYSGGVHDPLIPYYTRAVFILTISKHGEIIFIEVPKIFARIVEIIGTHGYRVSYYSVIII